MVAAGDTSVKMMVSYGGEIRRCPESGKARYAGGENRIVRVGMSERLRDLRARLAVLAGYLDVRLRYAVVEDGLDKLRDVDSEDDLWRLVTLLYCCSAGVAVGGRVRAFLFPVVADDSAVVLLFPPVPEQEGVSTPTMPRAKSKANMGHAAGSLPTERNAGTKLYAAGSSSSSATTSGDGTPVIIRAVSGFEALAAIAAERIQSSNTTYPDGTFVTHADKGFEALGAIAAQHSSNSTTTYPSSSSTATSSSASSANQAQAGSRFEALGEQKRQVCPASALILVPVPVQLAVFYPVVPVYGCVVLPGFGLCRTVVCCASACICCVLWENLRSASRSRRHVVHVIF